MEDSLLRWARVGADAKELPLSLANTSVLVDWDGVSELRAEDVPSEVGGERCLVMWADDAPAPKAFRPGKDWSVVRVGRPSKATSPDACAVENAVERRKVVLTFASEILARQRHFQRFVMIVHQTADVANFAEMLEVVKDETDAGVLTRQEDAHAVAWPNLVRTRCAQLDEPASALYKSADATLRARGVPENLVPQNTRQDLVLAWVAKDPGAPFKNSFKPILDALDALKVPDWPLLHAYNAPPTFVQQA